MLRANYSSLLVACSLLMGLQACSTPGPTVNADGELEYSETSQKIRNAEAMQILKAEPNSVVFFARGACCQSCSIGIRTKVASLGFVDQNRFNRGIKLEPKTQLVALAVKPGSDVVPVALSRAVQAAGFTPVHLYRLEGDKLVTTRLQ